jgi:hypothetical protein
MKKNEFMRFEQTRLSDNSLRSVNGGADLRSTHRVGAFYQNYDTISDGCTNFDNGAPEQCDSCCDEK